MKNNSNTQSINLRKSFLCLLVLLIITVSGFSQAGIWGIGVGANINKVLKIGYNFNIASTVAPRFYNNHEISIGINIFEFTKQKVGISPLKNDQNPKI